MTATTLADRVKAYNHNPTVLVTLDQVPLLGVEQFTVDQGFDQVSASAVVVTRSRPANLLFGSVRQTLVVKAGYDGLTAQVFQGYVETLTPAYDENGTFWTLTAAGWLKQSNLEYPSDVAYSFKTDSQIVTDALTRSGVPVGSINGSGQLLGAFADVVSRKGQPLWSLVSRVDELLGYKTFDSAGGPANRVRYTGAPAAGAAFKYVQGEPAADEYVMFAPQKVETYEGLYNGVFVTGLSSDNTPAYELVATNPLVPAAIGTVLFRYSSDLIETPILAQAVAERLMQDLNRVQGQWNVEAPGNPELRIGQTVKLASEKLDEASGTNFLVRHHQLSFDENRLTSRFKVAGGLGAVGQPVNVEPIAVMTYTVTVVTDDTGATSYQVICTGLFSYDPDGIIVTYTWSDSNGGSQSGSTPQDGVYSLTLDQTEYDAPTSVTLTVTDNDGLTNSVTVSILGTQGGGTGQPPTARALCVATDDAFYVSYDGGESWQAEGVPFTPGTPNIELDHYISTPKAPAADATYWGATSGELWYWGLVGNGSIVVGLVHTFGAEVTAIATDPNVNILLVGLSNGELWTTGTARDGTLGNASVWNLLHTFASPIVDVLDDNGGTLYVTAGNVWYKSIDRTTFTVVHTFAGAARHVTNSPFGNYACGVGAAAASVVKEDGTLITFPPLSPAVASCRGLTASLQGDDLYAADDQGRTFRKLPGATTFSQTGSPASPGVINMLLRDPVIEFTVYLAADDGLYVSSNGGNSWTQIKVVDTGFLAGLDGDGFVANALQLGGAGLSAIATPAVAVASAAGVGKVRTLWNGSGNDAPPVGWESIAYDDSTWVAPIFVTTHPSWLPIIGTDPLWKTDPPLASTEQNLFRHAFTLGGGVIASATLTVSCDDDCYGVWLNGVWLGEEKTGHGDNQLILSVPASILMPGQVNLLAVWGANILGTPGQAVVAYKLEVA